jgi:SAM-dependent methyltransferase
MLEVAQKEAEARHLQNIRFLQGDAHAIPCEGNSFDVVVCRQAAHHFPNVRQCVDEWVRVLKPGGKLLLIDSISPEEQDADTFLAEIEILRDPSHVRNHRISQWRVFLNEAGFTVNSVRAWTIFLDIPSWTQRMRTPSESVAIIEQRMRNVSSSVRERLHIEEQDGILSFLLPAVLIVATKSVEG